MAKATTVRFTDELYQRLDQASARTGLPVNSIVIAACLEWMQRHTPDPRHEAAGLPPPHMRFPGPPRWATVRRAVEQAVGRPIRGSAYPFDRFSEHAKEMLTCAQREAEKFGVSYIGTEHLLLAAFCDPESDSARILQTLGIDESAVRSMIEKTLQGGTPSRRSGIHPTSRVKRVIEMAFEICRNAGAPRVGTNHVLLALAAEGEGIAAHVLTDLGATREKLESANAQLPEPES
jgi:ClpA/ClpB-like protein